MHSARKKRKQKFQQIQHKTSIFPKVEESQKYSAEATHEHTNIFFF